jgi:NADH-quinone oxidoreductase subunit K
MIRFFLTPRHKNAMTVPLSYYLILSAILFGLGVAGFLFKRDIITIFMCVELMLNAVNLTFVALSYMFRQIDGQVFVFLIIGVAAAEAAVGLAIILAVFRNRASLNVDDMDQMKL